MSILAEHLETVPERSYDTTSLDVSVLRSLGSQSNRRDDSQYQLQALKTTIPLAIGDVACIIGSVLISCCIVTVLPFFEINR